MKETKPLKLFTNVNEKQIEMLDRIMKDNGLFSVSETVRFCIAYTYKKETPAYLEIQKDRIASKKNPEERAKEQVEMRTLRDEEKKNKSFKLKEGICNELAGTLEMINNQPHCIYKLYNEVPGGEVESLDMTEPFDTLSEDTVKFQYRDIMGQSGTAIRNRLKEKTK